MPLITSEMVTPSNVADLVIAIGAAFSAVLGAWGTMTIVRKRKEPAPVGSRDAMAVAMAENTTVMKEMNRLFGENNAEVKGVGAGVMQIAGNIADIRRDADAAREHLSAIRDGINRMAR